MLLAMNLNFSSLAWYMFVDLLVIGACRIYAPDFLREQNIAILIASSIVMWFIFDRKKR